MTSSRPHHSHTSCGDRSTAGTADMAAALARLASGVWLRPCLTDDPALPRTPVIAAWGMGLDSTAMIIAWVARGRPLDLVLTAATGSERPDTYDYHPIFQRRMHLPCIDPETVRYAPNGYTHLPHRKGGGQG